MLHLLLSPVEDDQVEKHLDNLKDFESVSKTLQSDSTILSQARTLFDALLAIHPQLNNYLGLSENSISRYPDFEKAIDKGIRGVAISAQEQLLLE